MATSLMNLAFTLHQQLAAITCPFHYISWNTEAQQWKFESMKISRMWPYYLMVVFNAICAASYFVAVIITRQGNLNHRYSTVALFTAGLFVLDYILVFLADYLFITNGKEWVQLNNYLYAKAQHTSFQGNTLPKRKSSFSKNISRKLIWKHLASKLKIYFHKLK